MSRPESPNNSNHDNSFQPLRHEDELRGLEDNLVQLQANVANVSLEPLRNIFSVDPDAANDAIMGDGDTAPGTMFRMITPKAKSSSLPPTPASKTLPSPVHEAWYPRRFDNNMEGKKCMEYLTFILKAYKNEAEAIRQLSYAQQLVPHIGCPKTTELWVILAPLLTRINNLQLAEVASDIAGYLYQEPDFVAPYLKCLNRLKPFLTRTSDQFFNLEERSTQLITMFESTISSAESHQEETAKFASQVSHVSANLAGLQEVLERTMIKVKKLDLLPDAGTHIPSGITIPSLSSKPQGSRVVLVDMNISGEYTGLYTISIENGKLNLVLPPRNNPEIANIVELPAPAQEVFVNLDQVEILNRLSNQPELRKALTGPPPKERAPFLYKLAHGVPKRTNQWTRLDYRASSSQHT